MEGPHEVRTLIVWNFRNARFLLDAMMLSAILSKPFFSNSSVRWSRPGQDRLEGLCHVISPAAEFGAPAFSLKTRILEWSGSIHCIYYPGSATAVKSWVILLKGGGKQTR
jgi:hypothetical protein